MELNAFDKMSYGLYVISTAEGDKVAACVVNTLVQATVQPMRVTVTINKENYTEQLLEQTGRFEAVVLSQSAMMELIGGFGFCCSKENDKFARWQHRVDGHGIPYLTEQVVARFACRVLERMDAGTHMVFLATVEEAEELGNGLPMTYAYYHKVKSGFTPPKASSYLPGPVNGYRCRLCGYVLDAKTFPDDFVCPVCGRGKEYLEKLTLEREGGDKA